MIRCVNSTSWPNNSSIAYKAFASEYKPRMGTNICIIVNYEIIKVTNLIWCIYNGVYIMFRPFI